MRIDDLVSSGVILRGQALAAMTTYKFGGRAKWLAEVGSRRELDQVLQARNVEPAPPAIFVLGRGSNVVISERGFDGLVIKLVGEFNELSLEGSTVVAGAGVTLPRLARFCAGHDRGGLEFYVGIPGSVGGAVVMNAGGHGADTAQWLLDASILDTDSGRVTTEGPQELELAYRHSRIGPAEVVLGARFRTIPRAAAEGERLMREISVWRRQHQPGGTYNAGSVFKNPPGDSAGRIIDAAGLKGFSCGGVSVSTRHANFFVADEAATAQDLYDLVAAVRRLIVEKEGIDLEPEIRFIGDFGGRP